MVQAAAGVVPEAVHLGLAHVDHRRGAREHRAAAQLLQARGLPGHAVRHGRADTGTGLGDARALLRDVGDDPLGGVGGGRGAVVGDEVEQRGIRLVPDGRHQRGAARRGGAHQRLVAERQQVLHGAAAAGHDDHVDARVGVQVGDRPADLRHGAHALHRDLPDDELDLGPPCPGVDDDVVLRLRLPAAHQPDDARQERQRHLALGAEHALRGEHPLEVLDAGQELPDADRADVVGVQLQGAALGPERRPGVDDDVRPLGERRLRGGEHLRRHRDGQRHVGVGVPERQERDARAGPPVELHDLALDPQRGHLGDVVGDLRGQQAHGPRPLGRGLDRAGRQVRGEPARTRRLGPPNIGGGLLHGPHPATPGRHRSRPRLTA
ncbi:hypothetical protein CHMI_03773 [Cellulomonas hominis]|nr:hypothetical protein CHMI_03773 [Cellulomonas hominis]